jgi:hypothetical protein
MILDPTYDASAACKALCTIQRRQHWVHNPTPYITLSSSSFLLIPLLLHLDTSILGTMGGIGGPTI